MKIVYCILVYDEPELLKRTINKLNSKNTHFIVHVQSSVDIKPFLVEQESVFFIPNDERIETIWGDFSCVQASLLMFRYARRLFTMENGDLDDGYCVLMSGTDYPIKSSDYIYNYFCDKYPVDFISRTCSKWDWPQDFRSIADNNCGDYWISYKNTKLKTWIRPRRFILPRCFRDQKILRLISTIPQFIRSVPAILKLFLFENVHNPYVSLFEDDEFWVSQTWMQLTIGTVCYLTEYTNDALFSRAYTLHNPEESFFVNIISARGDSKIINPSLVRIRSGEEGSMELDDSDIDYIKSFIDEKDYLFVRKMHYSTCKRLLNYIDMYES